MNLQLVTAPSLAGEAGVLQLQALQKDMARALANNDIDRVRQLDHTCAALLDKLVEANRDNRMLLTLALTDLKQVYANLINECQLRVTQACR
ncbi:MAG TPA: hypothetical protein VIC08_02185 [Cellvibrionaceae bacterium]